jgi:hypothetical protein
VRLLGQCPEELDCRQVEISPTFAILRRLRQPDEADVRAPGDRKRDRDNVGKLVPALPRINVRPAAAIRVTIKVPRNAMIPSSELAVFIGISTVLFNA